MPLPSRKSCSPGVEGKDEVEALEDRTEVGDYRTLLSLALIGGRVAWLGDHSFVNIAQRRKDPPWITPSPGAIG